MLSLQQQVVDRFATLNLVTQEDLDKCDHFTQWVMLHAKVLLLSSHVILTRQKDKSSKRGLIVLISRRNKVKKYLSRKHAASTIGKVDRLLQYGSLNSLRNV